jgi:multidrug efflux pump subunit AcrA (membrane-fusion protein)
MSCGKKTEETKPIRKNVTETVFATGVLEADNTYSLTAQTDGYLAEVNFNEGDIVEKGKILAVINNKENQFNTESAIALFDIARQNTEPDAPGLAKAKNEIVIAQQNLKQDSLQCIRYKNLLASNSIAKVDYENARLKYQTSRSNYENAKENYRLQKQSADQAVISNKAQKEVHRVMLKNNNIQAIVSGKVYEKRKEKGDFVKTGDVIAVIGDAQDIYAKINVDESNISKIKVGQSAIVQLNINKQKVYLATVKEIYPAFDENSQSFLCKLRFDDALDFKITGTQLQANIVIGSQDSALLIPRNYLNFDGTVQVKGEKQTRKVQTNFVSSDWVQITDGIDDNTTLVTDNLVANKSNPSEFSENMP